MLKLFYFAGGKRWLRWGNQEKSEAEGFELYGQCNVGDLRQHRLLFCLIDAKILVLLDCFVTDTAFFNLRKLGL